MNPAPGSEARATSCGWEHNGNGFCYDSGTMATLLEHTLLEAHDPSSGRYDAVRVGDSLGLSAAEMAHVVGWTPRGIRKNPASPKLQEPLTRLMATVTLLR